MLQLTPDREAFERVCAELAGGIELNAKHVVDVFGWPAMKLFLICTPESKKIIEVLKEIKRKCTI